MLERLVFGVMLAAAAGSPQNVGWTYAARPRDGKGVSHVVTGTPAPDPRSTLRPGTLSLRCTDKDRRLTLSYFSGSPGQRGPLTLSFDAAEAVLYYVEWDTNVSARLPVARFLERSATARVLTLAASGSPERYELGSLGPAVAELRRHCTFPEVPPASVDAAPPSGLWARRTVVAADGTEGVVLSLKGDNAVASLRLRCKGDEPDLYLAVDAGGLSSRNQPVALQLDQGPTLRVNATSGGDGKALYLAKPRDQIRGLFGHTRLNVAFAGPLGAAAVDSFDLTGVDETLAPWTEACGIKK